MRFSYDDAYRDEIKKISKPYVRRKIDLQIEIYVIAHYFGDVIGKCTDF